MPRCRQKGIVAKLSNLSAFATVVCGRMTGLRWELACRVWPTGYRQTIIDIVCIFLTPSEFHTTLQIAGSQLRQNVAASWRGRQVTNRVVAALNA